MTPIAVKWTRLDVGLGEDETMRYLVNGRRVDATSFHLVLRSLERAVFDFAIADQLDDVADRATAGSFGFDTLVALTRDILNVAYPADVFAGETDDAGALFVAKLREALAVLDVKERA